MKNLIKNLGWIFAILAGLMLIFGILGGLISQPVMGIKYGTYLWMASVFVQFGILAILITIAMKEPRE